jgi:small redox-active disulfide protein 2
MKKIEVLGPGCAKCEKLKELTQQAITELDLACEFEKVTDIQKIMAYGVMVTPALVVDGKVMVSGKVPAVHEIKQMIQ